ncbi:MAG: DNA recombination protein RmuC [Patescibacteria group bacterium]
MIIYLILVLGFIAVFVLLVKIWQKAGEKKDNQAELLLNQRLDNVTKLILDELKENRQSVQKTSLAMHQQVQSFTQGITKLEEGVKGVNESLKDVVSFQDIFKSPKLRGRWGETSLESVMAGYFPKERYSIQHYFKSGEAVDAVLKLPNNLLLPIDSKFNWENFEKMVNAEDEISKDGFRKQFISDVKKKIDEISLKYIIPAESTVDMALMYVPAEAVYYEVIHNVKDVDVSEYARKKKVILVSPNTFYSTLSAIHHWYRDVQITKQTKDIINRLARIKTDSEKLQDNFRRLGKHISDASGAYDDSEKRLTLLTDRVGNIVEMGDEPSDKTQGADRDLTESVS